MGGMRGAVPVLLLCLLMISSVSAAASDTGASHSQQVGAFVIRENAESLASKLEGEGKTTVVQESKTRDGKTMYRVFAAEGRTWGQQPLPAAASVTPEVPSAVTPAVAANDIYGTKGGYLHPFLSLGGFYTDNVYNTEDDRKSDYVTTIRPGIFLTLPGNREKVLSINSSNIAPGGVYFSRRDPRSFRPYQFHLFYGADIESYASETSFNNVSHTAEGVLQYNLRSGMTLEVGDRFRDSRDDPGISYAEVIDELDEYTSNLASVILLYDTRSKISFRADYRNFLVDYDATRNDFRNRSDNAIAGYVYYKIMPKTDMFVQYEFVDVDYRENVVSDSQEHNVYGGVRWKLTNKSVGQIKAGYGKKAFDWASVGDSNNFIYEAQIDHHFTPKTSAFLRFLRKTSETNVASTDYMISNGIQVGYLQRMTAKLKASMTFGYWNDDYRGEFTYEGVTDRRDDKIFIADIGLRYQFREELGLDLGYSYANRDSNFSDFSYSTNMFFFRLNGALGFDLPYQRGFY
jgi:polysaccharide biosynthesis protein VpsM